MEVEQSQKHQSTSSPSGPSTDTCEGHHGKLIEMYCEQHDEVCCAVCTDINHRSCKGVEYIPYIIKKRLREKDRLKVKFNLEEILRELENLRSKQVVFLKELNQQQDNIIKEIQQLKADLVKRFEQLERSSISEVEKRYYKISDNMNHDIEKVDQMLNDVETYLGNIKQSSYDDEVKLFVDMKLAERQVSKVNGCKTELIGKPLERMSYKLNTSIKRYLKAVDSMGKLKVSRRTISPFVNILVPYQGDAAQSFTRSIQVDLRGVGIHSKFINSFEIDADVYTVVVVRDLYDLLLLRVAREHHSKIILFILKKSRRGRRVVLEKGVHIDLPFRHKIDLFKDWNNVAKTISIYFIYSDMDEYIFNQYDKDRALWLVSATIDK